MNTSVTSLVSPDPIRYRKQISNELVAAFCSRLPTLVLIQAVLSTVIIMSATWEVVTPLQMTSWLAAHFAIVMFHYYVYRQFRARSGESLQRVRALLLCSMLLVGIFWAVLFAFLFVVIPDFLYRLYLFLFIGALGVLAVAVASENLLVLMAIIVPPSIVLSTMAIFLGQPNYVATGILSALSTAALVLFARIRHAFLVESLSMRFALVDLAHELGEQRDTAERANIAKSKFLAAASHDLRQPLHALTLLTAALQSSDIGTASRGIADDISAAVGSLEKMFAALLDISRLDAGVLQPELKHFQLDDLLRRLSGEYLPEVQARGLRLVCEVSAITVHSDPLLLERIIRNYLANALRYTQAGEIRVACRQVDAGVRVEVMDTGMGIASEQHAEIFSEFYQVGNPERDRAKGLGLGLAIVRRVSDLLQHPIGVESTLHSGARFYVVVPLGDAARVERAPTVTAHQHNLAGLRVLVIDDDAAVRDSMHTLLTLWNCHVVVAGDAIEALARSRATFACPDALVVDYRLREQCTGSEAIVQLRREFNAEIPALIVSGDTAPQRLREVAEGGHTLIHKPAQPAALRSFLTSALRLKNSIQ